MLPDLAMWPSLLAHLVVCGWALRWVRRRVGPRVTARGWIWVSLRVVAIGLAVGVVTAPGGPLQDPFALMLAWSWTLGIVLPVTLAVGAGTLLRGERGWAIGYAAASVAVAAVTLDAFVVEPTALEVSRHTLISSRVDRPLRIAIIADLQTDAPGRYEASALRAVMAERPDVIVLPAQ